MFKVYLKYGSKMDLKGLETNSIFQTNYTKFHNKLTTSSYRAIHKESNKIGFTFFLIFLAFSRIYQSSQIKEVELLQKGP